MIFDKRCLKKTNLDQIITVQKAKLGPDNNPQRVYIYRSIDRSILLLCSTTRESTDGKRKDGQTDAIVTATDLQNNCLFVIWSPALNRESYSSTGLQMFDRTVSRFFSLLFKILSQQLSRVVLMWVSSTVSLSWASALLLSFQSSACRTNAQRK